MLVLGFFIFLFFAALSAYLAEQQILNVVSGDLITPVVAGAIGAPLGNNLIGHFGPDIAGISLMPCMIGAMVLVLVTSLMSPNFRRKARGQDYDVSLFRVN